MALPQAAFWRCNRHSSARLSGVSCLVPSFSEWEFVFVALLCFFLFVFVLFFCFFVLFICVFCFLGRTGKKRGGERRRITPQNTDTPRAGIPGFAHGPASRPRGGGSPNVFALTREKQKKTPKNTQNTPKKQQKTPKKHQKNTKKKNRAYSRKISPNAKKKINSHGPAGAIKQGKFPLWTRRPSTPHAEVHFFWE